MSETLKARLVRCGSIAINQRHKIEAIAEQINNRGIENIFFAGSGGSITTLMAFSHLIKQYSSLPVYAEEAAELLVASYKQLTKHSLVIIMAKTGTMVETVELSRYCQQNKIPSLGFVIYDNTPVANQVDYKIMISEEDSVARYMPIYYFVFNLLYRRNEFPNYEKFVDNIEKLPTALGEVVDDFDESAKTFAKKYCNEQFQLYLYSSANMGEALKYSADIAEELFRHKTQLMHTAEFFHGCFEIADNETPIILLMSEDGSRRLDERALRFLKQYAPEKLTVIDPKKFVLSGIDKEFRPILTPIIINLCLTEMITPYMKEETGRSLETRRYYGIVSY